MSIIDFHHLSQTQRLALIRELWESLDADTIEPTPAQKAELDRRLATLDEDIEAGRTADQIIADLERRLR
jgi:putative addiction module component (TIGR02574 family)